MTALRFKTAGRHSTSSSSLRWRFWKIVPPSLLSDCGISFSCFIFFFQQDFWLTLKERQGHHRTEKKKHVSINKNRVKRRTLSHQSKAKGAYSSSVITNKGSKPEILSRIAQTTAALTRLKPVWNDMSVSLSSKIRLKLSEPISTSACRGTPVTVGKLGNVRSGKQAMPTQTGKKETNQLKWQYLICLRRWLDYQLGGVSL